MRWFRFYVEVLDDVKMLQLSDYEYRVWTYLLCYASEVNSTSGELQTTFTSLSHRFRMRFNHFSRAIETFQRLNIISINEHGYIVISNWNKKQFKSDNAYERVKKHREVSKKRNVSCNDIETPPDTDTDTDTEKDISTLAASPLKPDAETVKKEKAKAPKTRKARQTKTALPDNFVISEMVRAWARQKGHSRLDEHFESFKAKCKANGYEYVDWDSAFMEAIRSDWAKLQNTGGGNGRRPDSSGGSRIPEYRGEHAELSPEERAKNVERIRSLAGAIGAGTLSGEI